MSQSSDMPTLRGREGRLCLPSLGTLVETHVILYLGECECRNAWPYRGLLEWQVDCRTTNFHRARYSTFAHPIGIRFR